MKSNEQWVQEAIKVHGDKYDYSNVEYKGNKIKVSILCKGCETEFWQAPSNHLSGKECLKCSYKKRGEKQAHIKEQFIEKAKIVHGDKYGYSKVEYVNSKTKVCIICDKIDEITEEKHSEFWQTPYSHLCGSGCPKCTKNHRYSTNEWIDKAKSIHGNKYNYSKTLYKRVKSLVCIICPEHGEFWQTPSDHLNGQGCSKCSGVYKYNTSEWIEKAKKVHGERYDYSKVVYVNNSAKICIICKEHGEFWQTPANHIKGKNCPKCTGHFMDKDFFLEKAEKMYKDEGDNPLYDYSLVDYKDSSTYVTILCHKIDPVTGKEHGKFSKTPNKHLCGQGCPICGNKSGGLKNSLTNEEFLKRALTDKYEYLTEYVNAKTKIHIQCKKCGHKFWQEAFSHLSGCGCPICNESKLEKEVASILDQLNVQYQRQKRFKWLGRQSLDFYLPDYNIAIECQGKQHFEINSFGTMKGKEYVMEELNKIKERDDRKLKICLANNIQMIYVIDNEEYLENKYHFDIVEPFSGNVSYKIMHINHFENHINDLVDISHFWG